MSAPHSNPPATDVADRLRPAAPARPGTALATHSAHSTEDNARMLKLNLGCGPQVVPGWVNVDYAIGARLATKPLLKPILRRLALFHVDWDPNILIHDLTRRLPWADGTVDVCYTSHTVEHFSREEGKALVKEAYRVLKPGGVLRVVVPDLRPIIDRYQRGEMPSEDLVADLGVLYGPGKVGIKRVLAPLMEFPHKCMYDTEGMLRLFRSCGFEAESRAPFDSRIADIRAIELANRTVEAVVVEGVKV